MSADSGLARGLGLWESIAANMVTMIGSAIFVTIPLVLTAMGGPQAFLGWVLGMLISLADGLVWAELGTAMPNAGGPYIYLKEAFGPARLGRLLSFIFLWGAAISFPLISAFIAVSFAQYAQYFWSGMTVWQGKSLAAGVCALATVLLYRDISAVGKLSVSILIVVTSTLIWIVATGLWHFNRELAFDFPPGAFHLSSSFFAGLGTATIIAVLDYGGYCNVCYVAGEVERPAYTIPRAVLYSIVVTALCYLLTSMTVIGVIPWREASDSLTVISDFMRKLHGTFASYLVTALILLATAGSLFTSMLGFSRVLYAGAVDGQFFSFFARLHPTKRFPAASVLTLGGISTALCVFDLDILIKSISAVSTLTLCIPQVIALMVIRRYRPDIHRSFHMWLYPVPAVGALTGWIYVLLSNDRRVILVAIGVSAIGAAIYLLRARSERSWPFVRVENTP